MMNSEFNLVLKFCEALDEFVKVRVFADEDVRELVKRAAAADKTGFQREVAQACIIDYNPTVGQRVAASEDDDRRDLEEMLYLLCLDVNPSLDIHQVSVHMTSDEVVSAVDDDNGLLAIKSSRHTLHRIKDMESDIRLQIIGQDSAVNTVCKAVKKAVVGLRDPKRPIGAFLLVGQVGVGKTELAKALSDYLYGSQARLIRVDCSEYALPHEYAKLIGSPPGYIGHNEGGYLTEAAKELDEFIVLFDEIEKAHSKMHNILLQLLDEGMVTDSKGFKVSFRNALVLMTSNLGVREVEEAREAIGFGAKGVDDIPYETMIQEIQGALKKAFRPEFLNRLDDTIVFRTLTKNDSIKIVSKMMVELAEIARRAGIALSSTPELRHHVAMAGFKTEYGARELRRTIKRLIEEPLTDMLLSEEISQGDAVQLDIRGGKVRFDVMRTADSLVTN